MAHSATFIPKWQFFELFRLTNSTICTDGTAWRVRNVVRVTRNRIEGIAIRLIRLVLGLYV